MFSITGSGPAGRIRSCALVLAIALTAPVAAVEASSARPTDDRSTRIVPAGSSAAAPAESTDGCSRPWIAPVDAPITDPYRPPDHRYGPGNRGIEYGAAPGQAVLAVADGVVEFAGPVAGRPVVVIDHGGGLRSSYVNLRRRLVGRGQAVARGQRVATAETGFHLGARRGGHYVDPARLIERLCLIVRLVPL